MRRLCHAPATMKEGTIIYIKAVVKSFVAAGVPSLDGALEREPVASPFSCAASRGWGHLQTMPNRQSRGQLYSLLLAM